MNRACYNDEPDNNWALICWRGAVNRAIRGHRGQAFLREMLAALDALPEKKLIAHELQQGAQVCAIGAVGLKRGVDMAKIDPENYNHIANTFGIAQALVREIEFVNDDDFWSTHREETPEHRFQRVRSWVVARLNGEPT